MILLEEGDYEMGIDTHMYESDETYAEIAKKVLLEQGITCVYVYKNPGKYINPYYTSTIQLQGGKKLNLADIDFDIYQIPYECHSKIREYIRKNCKQIPFNYM